MWSSIGVATAHATIRSLNQPLPLAVEADSNDVPRAVRRGDTWKRVMAVQDVWRIDDEWWREPICRRYFQVELVGGELCTIFHDLHNDAWYVQRY